MEEQDRKPQVAVGCSGCLTLLCFLGLLAAALAPVVTGGKASWDESLPFIIISGACCFLSFFLVAGAGFWLFKSRQE